MLPRKPGTKAFASACIWNSDTGTGIQTSHIQGAITFGPTRLAPQHAPAQQLLLPVELFPATALADSTPRASCWSGLQRQWSVEGLAGVP